MSRAIATLRIFREIIQLTPIKFVLPIATSAVREASNKEEFLNQVYKETGFKFKILSDREEALYSYIGAIKSLRIPDTFFFDLGGGSLEIVYAERFKIKKVISLPLGALRLTQKFDGKNGKFDGKDYKDLKRYVWNLLPNKKDLGLSKDVRLVGVGGALRALTRYEQRISRYPLDKTHNYKISRKSLDSTVTGLSTMRSDEISKISVIGSSRAETIVAGSCVISTLVEKYGFADLYVSNHGLREGALSIYLEDPKIYHNGYIATTQIKKIISLDKLHKSSSEKENFVKNLLTFGLITKQEQRILTYAEEKISEKLSLSNPQSIFYSIMDEDMPLSHNDQLVLGLSLVHTRHPKTSDWLYTRYKSILSQQDKVSMKKISALLTLTKILERTKSKIELKKHRPRIIEINVIQSKSLPKFLLQDALRKFEVAFDIKMILSPRIVWTTSQDPMVEL